MDLGVPEEEVGRCIASSWEMTIHVGFGPVGVHDDGMSFAFYEDETGGEFGWHICIDVEGTITGLQKIWVKNAFGSDIVFQWDHGKKKVTC